MKGDHELFTILPIKDKKFKIKLGSCLIEARRMERWKMLLLVSLLTCTNFMKQREFFSNITTSRMWSYIYFVLTGVILFCTICSLSERFIR